ncbi:alkaline phosphatase family protein [Haloarcula marismortui]|uniref:Sulfatase N-terminal domain-containing protein n=1 Tax=Haloarcula marismortui (strain ATCC 43049 / DSM 3752 / JCM 8966 / VKM B-1809) TaxID=272569 RepID=A0A4P8JW52_HALMA|nr:hypothetical protein [Haloarcula marismortui]QCP90747.1 hypothetical protein E6P14_07660 [Haloarcula marismortui ATCC 43049]
MTEYNLSHVKRGLRNPHRVALEIYKLYQRKILKNTGVRILDRDWDNLIILDGCRYDIFAKSDYPDGQLQKEISRGSQTEEFLKKNFPSKKYPDIVYISANPNIKYLNSKFFKRVRLWENQWNNELNVVHPESVTDWVIENAEEYANKRMIVHYMQPHYPFIGDTGQDLMSSPEIAHLTDGNEFWRQYKKLSEQDKSRFREAYNENLAITINHVDRALGSLKGKTVVTSDHGNEFGKWGIYGHPAGVYSDGLVEVPWLVINQEGNTRKQIIGGNATDGPANNDALVEERLKYLGYK